MSRDSKVCMQIQECEADPRRPETKVYTYRVLLGPNVAHKSLQFTDDGKLPNQMSQMMTAASVKWWISSFPEIRFQVHTVEMQGPEALNMSVDEIVTAFLKRINLVGQETSDIELM